jgi:putative membrane protein insertion efficiency factor
VTLVARALHGLVRVYQRLTAGRPSPCRFDPSCSTFALEALERHGAVRGTWLSIRRLSRCHPWGGMGWDPVPERKAN